MRSLFGISTGLLLSGTAFAVVLAYTIRLFAASTLVSLYRYEEAGLSALTIVLVSLAPVPLLHGIIARSRAGSLGEPFCRNRRGRGIGVAGREISQENTSVGLAISAQSG